MATQYLWVMKTRSKLFHYIEEGAALTVCEQITRAGIHHVVMGVPPDDRKLCRYCNRRERAP